MKSKSFKNNIDISQVLFKKAKYQFDNGIIDSDLYKETLELILNKIDVAELEYNKVDFIISELQKEVVLIDIRETINVAFALN